MSVTSLVSNPVPGGIAHSICLSATVTAAPVHTSLPTVTSLTSRDPIGPKEVPVIVNVPPACVTAETEATVGGAMAGPPSSLRMPWPDIPDESLFPVSLLTRPFETSTSRCMSHVDASPGMAASHTLAHSVVHFTSVCAALTAQSRTWISPPEMVTNRLPAA